MGFPKVSSLIEAVPVEPKQHATGGDLSAVKLRTDFAVVPSDRHEKGGLPAQVFARSCVGGVGHFHVLNPNGRGCSKRETRFQQSTRAKRHSRVSGLQR